MTFWNPVKTDNNAEKRMILAIAKQEIEKKLEKLEKKISKLSDEYRKMDVFTTNNKRRSAKRLSLEAECEERDRQQRRLEIIDNWIKEFI